MSPASVVRELVIRDWVVDATDAIDLLERLPELLVEVRTLHGISQRGCPPDGHLSGHRVAD